MNITKTLIHLCCGYEKLIKDFIVTENGLNFFSGPKADV